MSPSGPTPPPHLLDASDKLREEVARPHVEDSDPELGGLPHDSLPRPPLVRRVYRVYRLVQSREAVGLEERGERWYDYHLVLHPHELLHGCSVDLRLPVGG